MLPVAALRAAGHGTLLRVCSKVCVPSSVPVSPLRSSMVGEGKSGRPARRSASPAGPVPPASEGGDGVENNDTLCVRH